MERKILMFIKNSLEKRHALNSDIDLLNLNYVEEGYIDSLGMFQFLMEIEEEFNVEFSEEEMFSKEIMEVSKLTDFILKKIDKQ